MTIRVWHRQTAQSICLAGQPATASSIAVRNNLVAAGDAAGGVFFFDLKNHAPPPRASPSCDCLTLPPTQFKPFLVDTASDTDAAGAEDNYDSGLNRDFEVLNRVTQRLKLGDFK